MLQFFSPKSVSCVPIIIHWTFICFICRFFAADSPQKLKSKIPFALTMASKKTIASRWKRPETWAVESTLTGTSVCTNLLGVKISNHRIANIIQQAVRRCPSKVVAVDAAQFNSSGKTNQTSLKSSSNPRQKSRVSTPGQADKAVGRTSLKPNRWTRKINNACPKVSHIQKKKNLHMSLNNTFPWIR